MAIRSGALIGTSAITASADQVRYELPEDCVQVVNITRRSPREVVEPITVREVDEARHAWQTMTGDRFQWYFIFGVRDIFLIPAPSTGGEVYDVTYRKDPGDASLVADTDAPGLPRRFHDALIDYVVARALLVEASPDQLGTAKQAMGQFITDTIQLRKLAHRPPDRAHQMRGEDYSGGWIG